jgi:hypothetical protein
MGGVKKPILKSIGKLARGRTGGDVTKSNESEKD